MPELKTYDLFISHAWKYNDDYSRLVKMLDEAPNFKKRNYSVPEHDPLVEPDTEVGKKKLTEMLKNQIKPVNCVLILSGIYASYSYWIQKEIDLSSEYKKPIIGIKPWGQQRNSQEVQNAAIEMIAWNTDSIIKAIRKYSL